MNDERSGCSHPSCHLVLVVPPAVVQPASTCEELRVILWIVIHHHHDLARGDRRLGLAVVVNLLLGALIIAVRRTRTWAK